MLKYTGGTWINDAAVDILNLVADGEYLKRSGTTIVGTSGTTLTVWGTITGTLSGQTDLNNELTGLTASIATKADKLAVINDITGTTYTTVDGDSNEILEASNTGATTITLASGATTGFQVTVVNTGAQTITFAAMAGSTLRSKASAVTCPNEFGAVSAYKNGTYWYLIGDLE